MRNYITENRIIYFYRDLIFSFNILFLYRTETCALRVTHTTDHCVGRGSCHNGCILDVYLIRLSTVDPFFSFSILCDRICFRLKDP